MFPELAPVAEFPQSSHPGTVTFVGIDGTERTESAAQLPDWLKFAPGADGSPVPVVRVVRCAAANGHTLRSFGPDGRLLWVTLMVPPAPPTEPNRYRMDTATHRTPHGTAATGWF